MHRISVDKLYGWTYVCPAHQQCYNWRCYHVKALVMGFIAVSQERFDKSLVAKIW